MTKETNTTRHQPPKSIEAAIKSRRSIRAFLPDPVADETVRDLLNLAMRAPSGTNTQPWKVHVVRGAARDQLCDEVVAAFLAGDQYSEEYAYAPDPWGEPYLGRRRATGWGLYGALGIKKGDKEKMLAQHARNFRFFDAPVGLFITIDRGLELGSWVDTGLFMQTLMLAARGHGLDTCPQQAFAGFHAIIQKRLAIPADQMVVCGMALGYADMSAPENHFTPDRVPVDEFARFVDDLTK
ncbi:nitroreductase [Profundibacter sp.]